jgi:hypothetical protein
MTNLSPRTLYHFRTYLSNAYNEAWSETRTFMTGPWELPFAETFETLAAGNIQGQRGWVATPNRAGLVQTAAVHAGSRAGTVTNLLSSGSSSLSHAFDGTASTNVVWTDFYARPVFNALDEFSVDPSATVVFWVRTNSGHVVVYDGTNATVLAAKPAVLPGVWTRFTVRADYGARQWALFMDGLPMAQDLAFYNTNVSRFARFVAEEGSASASFVDDLSISLTQPKLRDMGSLFKLR